MAMQTTTHENFEDFTAGSGDNQSNWPGDYLAQIARKTPRLKPLRYFVDVDGETMGKAHDNGAAKTLARSLQAQFPCARIEIRTWQESEESAAEDYEQERANLWATTLYKPTPARRAR